MTYFINKTDGTILSNVADGQVDQLSSDLTLIGKNYSGFGEALNENFVKLLENFANSVRPTHPIRGQIWFDTAESKLKVYNGTSFVPVSSASVSNSRPSALGVGDLWYNNIDKQLYFFDGTNTVLVGPDYSTSQGISGIKVASILDKNNITRVVAYLYTGGVLLGIFSKDEFIPKNTIIGFNDNVTDKLISPGFNAGTLSGLKFSVTATNADRLDNVLATNYARKDQPNTFTAQTVVSSDDGIIFGAGRQGILDIDSGIVRLSNTATNRNIEIKVRKNIESETAIGISTSTREVKIYEGKLDSTTTIGGNMLVNGNLTVLGQSVYVDVADLRVESKNIELGISSDSSILSDAGADGGGFTLHGSEDHSIIWLYNTAVAGQANSSWNFNDNINLSSSKSYKINGVDVLTSTTCFASAFPNLTGIGPQVNFTIGDIYIDGHTISSGTSSNADIMLSPDGTGNVVVDGKKVYGLTTTNEGYPSQIAETASLTAAVPLSATELSEATTKKYVTNFVRRRSLVLSMDISDSPSNAEVAVLLTQVAPPDEHENGTIARILCTILTNSTSIADVNSRIVKSFDTEYNTPTGTGFPLSDVSVNAVTVPAQSMQVTREVKTFIIIAGAWAFQA